MNKINNLETQKGELSHLCIKRIEGFLAKLIDFEAKANSEELSEVFSYISDELFYDVWDYFQDTKMDFIAIPKFDDLNKELEKNNKFKIVNVHDEKDNLITISLNYKINNGKVIFTEVLSEVAC